MINNDTENTTHKTKDRATPTPNHDRNHTLYNMGSPGTTHSRIWDRQESHTLEYGIDRNHTL